MLSPKAWFAILKSSGEDFLEDECPLRAAGLAYYTIFSLPPLLVLTLMLVGTIWDPHTIQQAMEGQAASLMGPEAAREIHTMIQSSNRPGGGGIFATLVGLAGLVFGATGAFMQLQGALNRAWEVEPDPRKGGVRRMLLKRVFSFGMIIGVAFLLLVSLVISAAISAFGRVLTGALPGGVSQVLLYLFDLGLSLALITLLFAIIYKVLPDARIAWRNVWAGALATAVLFVAGKFGIGFYLSQSNPGEAFGAAGSLAVLLLWIYYSGLIVLFGAEFTQAWTRRHEGKIQPDEDALRVIEEKHYLDAEGREVEPAAEEG